MLKMQKTSQFLVIFLILVGTVFFAVSEARAVTVNCIFDWPQKVVVNGFNHTCGPDRNYCNYDKAGLGIPECCANYPYSDCVKAGPATSYDVNTVFAVEAWDVNHDTWGKCAYQDASVGELSAYCKSKGYAKLWPAENSCYKSGSVIRYAWNGALPMVKGADKGLGIGLITIKCSNSGYCTENWSCGSWTACAGGQQTRTCTDLNNCGSVVSKPAVSQSCSCTPNWSCSAWPTCSGGHKTRTCTDLNNCGTTEGKPATTQGCESLSCTVIAPDSEAIIYQNGSTGVTEQIMCHSSFHHCKVAGMVGRCCPTAGSMNINCMVDWPKRTILQGDSAADKKTLTIGGSWNVRGGLVLTAMSIDAKSNPGQAWLVLNQNGVKVDDKVVNRGQWYLYGDNNHGSMDFNLFGVYIDSVFAGATSDMVQLRYAYYNSIWENELSNCSENWSCGDWSSCFNHQQTRTCTDSNNCGTTVTKPSVSQGCSCTENWSCGNWASCSNFLQARTCTDTNNCGTTYNKPTESQSCCAEDWSCSAWSSCFNNQQTRTCTDANSCGTIAEKPAVSQLCSCTESWSCGNWSSCFSGLHTRACVDFNNCGTTLSKPEVSQSCDTTCTENWSCGAWTTCAGGQQTRICSDSGNCGTTATKPAVSQSCTVAVPNPPTMDISCPSLQAGDMIKVTGKPAIYVLNNDLKVLYFPSGDEFKSWKPTYGGYVSITEACFDSLPVPNTYPAAVNFRPGSYVIKKASADQLYVVEPNNTLAKITPEAAAVLYGANYQVMKVADAFWPHYINRGTDIISAVPHPGMLIKSGATTYYVEAGNKMREVDSTGLTTNEFQTKFVRTVVPSVISNLSVGERISDRVSVLTDKTQSSN